MPPIAEKGEVEHWLEQTCVEQAPSQVTMDTATTTGMELVAATTAWTWSPSTEATFTAATSTPTSATVGWAASLEKGRLPVARACALMPAKH